MKEVLDKPIVIGRYDAELLTDSGKNMSAPFGMPTTSPPADKLLDEGDIVKVGDGELKVFHTPGHSPGSIVLAADGFAIVGDLLFAGSIGRVDFPGGDYKTIIDSIKRQVIALGDKTVIYPGHGPKTDVAQEKVFNPFLIGG